MSGIGAIFIRKLILMNFMNSSIVFKIVVFIGCLIASRVILRRVSKYLTEGQLQLLAENSKAISLMRNVLVYGTAILLFILGRAAPDLVEVIQPILLAVLLIGMSVVVFLSYRKFNELNLPAKARNAYILSVAVLIAGIIFILLPI